MDNTKQRIMECCIKEVIENDLKTITMDSIAKKLAISKKTIYEHFNNKEMLIEDTLLFYSNFLISFVKEDAKNYDNPFMQLLQTTLHLIYYVGKVSIAKKQSILRTYPQIAKKTTTGNYEFITKFIIPLIKKSQKEEYITNQFTPEYILALLFAHKLEYHPIEKIELIGKTYNYNSLSIMRIFVMIKGLSTHKGEEEMNKLRIQFSDSNPEDLKKEFEKIIENFTVESNNKTI